MAVVVAVGGGVTCSMPPLFVAGMVCSWKGAVGVIVCGGSVAVGGGVAGCCWVCPTLAGVVVVVGGCEGSQNGCGALPIWYVMAQLFVG